MLKSLTYSLIALVLTFSVLGPSIDTLFKVAADEVYVIDFNEEENKNESEKKFDEKLFFSTSLANQNYFISQEIIFGQWYFTTNSQFSSEIVPPPPKSNV